MTKTKGFTLIEVLITLSLVAILCMSALPSYRSQQIREQTLRASLKLQQLALDLQQHHLKQGTYEGLIYNHYLDEPDFRLKIALANEDQFQIFVEWLHNSHGKVLALDQDGNEIISTSH